MFPLPKWSYRSWWSDPFVFMQLTRSFTSVRRPSSNFGGGLCKTHHRLWRRYLGHTDLPVLVGIFDTDWSGPFEQLRFAHPLKIPNKYWFQSTEYMQTRCHSSLSVVWYTDSSLFVVLIRGFYIVMWCRLLGFFRIIIPEMSDICSDGNIYENDLHRFRSHNKT